MTNFFSRLTDIVTCDLTALLSDVEDPAEAVDEIIREMETGLEGARRSVAAATTNEQHIRSSIEEHARQQSTWGDQARDKLQQGDETGARQALQRKQEMQKLVDGLKQQLEVAEATRKQLTTTLHALEARIAEARRHQAVLKAGESLGGEVTAGGEASERASSPEEDSAIEAELAALKRELGQ